MFEDGFGIDSMSESSVSVSADLSVSTLASYDDLSAKHSDVNTKNGQQCSGLLSEGGKKFTYFYSVKYDQQPAAFGALFTQLNRTDGLSSSTTVLIPPPANAGSVHYQTSVLQARAFILPAPNRDGYVELQLTAVGDEIFFDEKGKKVVFTRAGGDAKKYDFEYEPINSCRPKASTSHDKPPSMVDACMDGTIAQNPSPYGLWEVTILNGYTSSSSFVSATEIRFEFELRSWRRSDVSSDGVTYFFDSEGGGEIKCWDDGSSRCGSDSCEGQSCTGGACISPMVEVCKVGALCRDATPRSVCPQDSGFKRCTHFARF
jgi:hypothetical protein